MSDGVKLVNENIMKKGRTIIVTDANIPYGSLPDGTLFVDPNSGDIKEKLNGKASWTKLPIAKNVIVSPIRPDTTNMEIGTIWIDISK